MGLLVRIVNMLPIGARYALARALSGRYRKDPSGASNTYLYLLGIANGDYRKDFRTIERIIEGIPRFEGDIIECGVFRGETLFGMAHLAIQKDPSIHVYGLDSFMGFPEPDEKDRLGDGTIHEKAKKGVFSDTSYDDLMKNIERFGFAKNVHLVKGFFEDTLPGLKDRRYHLAYLDCDLYRSYKTCLEHIYDRVVPGGYIVFDEYDYSEGVYPGAKRAIDEFLAGRPEKVERFDDMGSYRYFIRKA